MSMHIERFGEYSGDEKAGITSDNAASLRRLNGTMAILMYEEVAQNDVVRIGLLKDVKYHDDEVHFRFKELGRVDRSGVYDFAADPQQTLFDLLGQVALRAPGDEHE
jgi:hypothetical protein